MKKGSIYFVAIVAIIIGVVATIPGFLNWNEYKQEVADTIYSQTGHRVNIDGNLVVRLLPSPSLAAEDISLLDPNGAQFLKLDSLSINVGFFALVMGRVEAESVVLEGGLLSLERNIDNVANWQFLLPDANEADPSNADDMRFDYVSIDGLEVHYKDAIFARDDVFKNIDATLKAGSAKGPFSVSSSYYYGGVGFELEASSGRIETSHSFPLSLNLIVAGFEPGINFQGTVVIDGAASAASGQFKAGGDDLGEVLSGLMLLATGIEPEALPVNLDKKFNISAPLVLTKARMTARPFALEVGEVKGEGEILASPEAEDGATADLMLKLNNIVVENWLRENAPLTTSTEISNRTANQFKINYNLEIGTVSYAGEVARRSHAKGNFDGIKLRVDEAATLLPGSTEVKISGGLNLEENPVFRGNLDLNSNNIRTSLTWLGQDLTEIPQDKLMSFALRSIINVGRDGFAITGATGQLDGIQYSGNMAAEIAGEAKYIANISLSSLDVENYFPAKQQSAGDRTWAQVTKDIENTLSPLQGLNVELKLKADKFSIGDARFTNLQLDTKLAQNRLNIASFSTTDFKGVKGSLSGSVDGIGGKPRFNFDMDLESPSLAALTRWSGVELPVDVYKLAAVSLKGHVDGTTEQVNLNVAGRAAHANYSVNGYLGGLNPKPEQMNVRISVSGDDHQDFIRRMDMPLQMSGDGMGFTLAGGINGELSALESNLTLDIIGGQAVINGLFDAEASTPSFDIAIEANHPRFVAVSDALGFGFNPDDDDQLGRFRLIGNISAKNGIYLSNDMVGWFGPTQYGLDMGYDNSGPKPKLSGTLSMDILPLSRFFGSSTTGATAAKEAGGRRWSRKPFELDWMREIDIDVGFDGQEISYDEYSYMEPQFKIELENGVLNIRDFKGQMFSGRVLGQLRLDVNSVPSGSVVITLEEASLKQALEVSAAISPATGKLSLRSDVSFSGISQYDAVNSLNGNVEIWAQNGVIKGVDIDRISRRLARLNRLPDFLSLLGSGLSGGETPFGNIRANFVGDGGVFTARNIIADIEGADVEGRMRLDLPQWTMTGTGSIKFNEVELPATELPTKEVVDATGQVTIEAIPAPPVRDVPPIGVDMAGDIDNPTINYRTDRLRAFMAERFASSLLNNITGGEGGIGAIFGIPTPTTQPEQQAPQEDEAPVEQGGQGDVDPADVIVNTLFDMFRPQQQTESQTEPQTEPAPDDDN